MNSDNEMRLRDLPNKSVLTKIWCDFNNWGGSGESDDNCYYMFDQGAVRAGGLEAGSLVFIWDEDGIGEVIGRLGRLELYSNVYRIRPINDTIYRGCTADL